jgi:hypothetical protein
LNIFPTNYIYLWSSSPAPSPYNNIKKIEHSMSIDFLFNSASSSSGSNRFRASGQSVRCIQGLKDKKFPLYKFPKQD